MKPVKAKKIEIPAELLGALKDDLNLKDKYDQLTPGKQREYAEHIGSAKQEATGISRLQEAIPMIMEGKGLNDKYRK